MKYQVEELEGALLDAAVAKAEGLPFRIFPANDLCNVEIEVDGEPTWCAWGPSAYWGHGGPIIERDQIGIATEPVYGWIAGRIEAVDGLEGPQLGFNAHGPTPLIAAMRCKVASVYGDEVDLP